MYFGGFPGMTPSNCLNCGHPLTQDYSYCPSCGQETDVHRITFRHFIHEFIHAFTHADKGIFHLLKDLVIRPGLVARNYIAGKRKSYFNPFTFFLIVMGIFVFINVYFKELANYEVNPNVLARIPTEQGRQQYTRGMQAREFMDQHGNLIALIAIPFISLITWSIYYRKKYNYTEHLTANMLFITFANLLFAVLVFPLQGLAWAMLDGRYITFGGLLIQAIYLSWALNGFLALRTTAQRIGSFLASLLTIILWLVFWINLMGLYIYQNENFYQFFERFLKAKH